MFGVVLLLALTVSSSGDWQVSGGAPPCHERGPPGRQPSLLLQLMDLLLLRR